MFGLNDNQKQINESLRPIKEQLETHSVILEEFVKFKPECSHDRRRLNDKLDLIIDNQSKFSAKLEKSDEYHEKNAENLQVLADLVIASKAGKKSIPMLSMIVGSAAIIITVVVWFVHYLNKIIEAIS
jgi:hypothetical protein